MRRTRLMRDTHRMQCTRPTNTRSRITPHPESGRTALRNTKLDSPGGPRMKIEIISLFLILFSVVVIILGIVKIHTYPGRIAKERGHPQLEAIEVTSLLGLIIFPLWMLALVWAYSGAVIGILYERPKRAESTPATPDPREESPP